MAGQAAQGGFHVIHKQPPGHPACRDGRCGGRSRGRERRHRGGEDVGQQPRHHYSGEDGVAGLDSEVRIKLACSLRIRIGACASLPAFGPDGAGR
jgi:hypothetical protein